MAADTSMAAGQPMDRTLIGKRVGRFTIIGRAPRPTHSKRTGKQPQWVVRCDCGTYEQRKQKTLLREQGEDFACRECQYVLQQQKHERQRRTGRYEEP